MSESKAQQFALFGSVIIAVFMLGLLLTNWDKVGPYIQGTPNAAKNSCMFLRVHDGDTIRCGTERVRLADIDAPELPGSPKCEGSRAASAWCDYGLARQSRDTLRSFLSSGSVEVERQGEDKYGRTLAIVRVDGVSAGDHLIARGLAKPWN